MNEANIQNQEFRQEEYQSATFALEEDLSMSEYELFKLRQTRKATKREEDVFIGSKAVLIIVASFLAVVYLCGYLSEQVQPAWDTHTTSSYNQNADELFYLSPKGKQESHNISISTTRSRLSAQFLPAHISKAQIAFASELKSLTSMEYPQLTPLADKERAYYVQKYKVDRYKQLPFCVVVPTFNNTAKSRHLRNIKSITMQDYQNYHIVVIDDASNDGTGTAILQFLQKESKIQGERYKVIFNSQRKMAMYNLRTAAMEHCQSDEIFLVVDGDDELLGTQVFKVFNAVFQSQNAWFVYSNFITLNSRYGYSRPIPEEIIKANRYRYYPFVTSHLRAFYTKLFQNIREQDLKDEKGEYFRAANDVAICIPVIQQAGTKVYYLAELMYVYNSNTGMNNHQVKQGEQIINTGKIRRKKKYFPLQGLS